MGTEERKTKKKKDFGAKTRERPSISQIEERLKLAEDEGRTLEVFMALTELRGAAVAM